ncbi:BRI1 KINASE INHIBITOR 1 [Salix purpurea]|uniref:BRI1 KINASE INHIBITOR 1 n=1 Tax=Salix purpurea TaxID=77065 RepID=A0A9Q0SR18_SALPP|nr:BRI1 KINASE INHIBITOR 1 [Salix purpurea]
MDTKTQRNSREEVAGKAQEGNLKRDGKEGLQEKQQALPTSPASPSSASSSPSHEFSFTISLHSASAPVLPDNAKTPPCSFAIDLSPADDIFFHGHLLPLHLLSHLHVSPRSSTNSLDGSTLPVKELLDDQRPSKSSNNCRTSNGNSGSSSSTINKCSRHRSKPKSFSLFGWRKGCEVKEKEEGKKRLRFDVSQVLKRYARKVRPLMFFKGRRENLQFHKQPYSFPGNLSWRNKQELRGTIGEYSAPASMRASPANSGLLLATTTLPSSTSDSTMEEFQASIQAAIAHCKNSITAEDR